MSNKKDIFAPIKAKLNPLFEKIGELTKIQRLVICLLTFAIVGGGWYYFIFMPKQEELQKARQTYNSKKRQLANYKKAASELLKYEQKMAATQQEFNLAMRALPDKRELPSLLTNISKAGSVAGLDFHLFKPESEKNQTFFKEIPVSIKVEGRYHQITDFFFQVIRLNRIVNINNVEVKSKKGGNLLQMSCKAVTYMFIEQKEQDKNKKKRKRKK